MFNFDKKYELNSINNKMNLLQKKLYQMTLGSSQHRNIKVSFSFGSYNFNKEEDFESVLEKSDLLMYKNKKDMEIYFKNKEV